MNGINGINQQTDIQKLLQLMKNGKGGSAAQQAKLPQHMTKNGSIFNAPRTQGSPSTQSSFSINNTNFISGFLEIICKFCSNIHLI